MMFHDIFKETITFYFSMNCSVIYDIFDEKSVNNYWLKLSIQTLILFLMKILIIMNYFSVRLIMFHDIFKETIIFYFSMDCPMIHDIFNEKSVNNY